MVYPNDLSLKSNTSSNSDASNSTILTWKSPSRHRPSLTSLSPDLRSLYEYSCLHFSQHSMLPCRTVGLCSKKMRVLQVWEARQNQTNLKINLSRENTYGSPGMKHIKYTKCTTKVSSILPLPVHRRPTSLKVKAKNLLLWANIFKLGPLGISSNCTYRSRSGYREKKNRAPSDLDHIQTHLWSPHLKIKLTGSVKSNN